MSTPFISFIIPTYNTPSALLRQCIESILAINLVENERQIILVDDNSKQPALEAVKKYAAHITYLRFAQNKGQAAARNAALAQATGTYIQFIDADDALFPQRYNYVLQALRHSASQQPDVLVFNFSRDAAADSSSSITWSAPITGIHYLCHHNMRAACWGYVSKRELLNNLHFIEGNMHEDEDFTPRAIIRAHTLCFTTTPIYYYRLRANSISNSPAPSHLLRKLADKEQILLNLANDHWTSAEQPAITRRLHQLTADLLYNVWTYTHSLRKLRQTILRLHQHSLCPLPLNFYSPRYWAWVLALKCIGA